MSLLWRKCPFPINNIFVRSYAFLFDIFFLYDFKKKKSQVYLFAWIIKGKENKRIYFFNKLVVD